MRYRDNGPRSAEILRLVLPNISKHVGTYVPTTYAVWYEHLAGTNSRLSIDLTDRLQKSDSLDQQAVEELYSEHILSGQVRDNELLQ